MTRENQFSYQNVKAALEAGVISGDGHTIFAPEKYNKYFDVEHLVTDHASVGSGKHALFDLETGERMESCMGIYNLTFMYWIGEQLGLEYRTTSGRGFQAQAIHKAVQDWVEGHTVVELDVVQ